ncbi:hypothetical protein NDU88_003630 [Pleurodeles waltl]|uniref:Uncharacterized protein n=1 Tax=Pleurodeles waltl TaxID=8319 RepID=A0AAV7NIR5_PLEWA|nr:hypothetical protein NDU88_003630 [Pleurodeles waltl]
MRKNERKYAQNEVQSEGLNGRVIQVSSCPFKPIPLETEEVWLGHWPRRQDQYKSAHENPEGLLPPEEELRGHGMPEKAPEDDKEDYRKIETASLPCGNRTTETIKTTKYYI